ncbi:MAG: sporulation integral membrane protein YtvI [Lachnospiraceae bacterium]
MSTFRHYFKIFLNIVIPCVSLFLLFWLGPKIIVFFWPFVLGFLLAKMANPLVAFISEKCKIRRKAVSAFVIILVLAVIVLIIYGICSFLGEQTIGFMEDLPGMWKAAEAELSAVAAHFTKLYNKFPADLKDTLVSVQASLDSYISDVMSKISTPTVNAIGNAAKHIPSLLIGIIMCFLSAYFFIADKDYAGNFLKKYIPDSILMKWDLVWGSLLRSVGGYFKAQLKIEIWMYVLLYLGLILANVNYAALVALGIAVLDFFPVFGTGTVLVPWAIIKLLSGEYLQAIILAALWGGGQLLRQIIQPKIMGDSMGMPPIPTLFLLYIGWKISGVWGMIFALPVAIIILNLNEAGIFDQAKTSVRYLVRDVNKFRKFTPDDEDFNE